MLDPSKKTLTCEGTKRITVIPKKYVTRLSDRIPDINVTYNGESGPRGTFLLHLVVTACRYVNYVRGIRHNSMTSIQYVPSLYQTEISLNN